MDAQIDWIRLEDHAAQARRLLALAAQRIGVGELAHKLDEDPSTVVHQLRRDGSKRPSADLLVLCFLLDAEFRGGLAAICGEVLSRPPDLTPEQALREIVAKAESSFDKRALADVLGVYARTKREAKP